MQQAVRLTEEENMRLHRQVRRKSGSVQQYLRTVIQEALAHDEGGRAVEAAPPVLESVEPAGFGADFRERLAPPPPPPPANVLTAPLAPTVVVASAVPTAPTDWLVERLVAYVVNGEQWSRPMRLREARQALSWIAKGEERASLQTLFDERLARTSGPGTLNSLMSLFKR